MFGFGKKEEKKQNCGCACSPVAGENAAAAAGAAGIQVLGGGCAKCHTLAANAEAALAKLGRQEPVELVTDFAVIAAYGVMATPALVIDRQVVSSGRVLSPAEIAEAIQKVRG